MLEAMKLAFKTQKVCASSNLRMLLGVLERQLLQYTVSLLQCYGKLMALWQTGRGEECTPRFAMREVSRVDWVTTSCLLIL